ncbi:hypothetical protein T492DRAFT_863530 [Pavlovales sp. CCMP2436]|nr:hypothetical protein T492DRAFT_863530 [Pavlovales sp. CCMP2436]
MALFKLSAILLPLIAGPMDMRSLVLVCNSIVFRESATIHRLRRALEKGDFARTAELADVSPYEMPCFEPCDRLIVAELMDKKRQGRAAVITDMRV